MCVIRLYCIKTKYFHYKLLECVPNVLVSVPGVLVCVPDVLECVVDLRPARPRADIRQFLRNCCQSVSYLRMRARAHPCARMRTSAQKARGRVRAKCSNVKAP